MDISRIQAALVASQLDGWLFVDHHRRDPLAYRILGIPDDVEPTRRWYYFVPASGEPLKLLHRIEGNVLDSLPGESAAYASWTDQYSKCGRMLFGSKRVAMQYSHNCAIPSVSLVDAGTADLIRSFGVEIVSSASLVQEFESKLSQKQIQTHGEAGRHVDRIRSEAFDFIGQRLRAGEPVTEFEVQQFILQRFSQCNLIAEHGPIVARNQNASNPHFEPSQHFSSTIEVGDLVLIDLWAKLDVPDSVYYDVTWTGVCGEYIPERIGEIFQVVCQARRAACAFVIERAAKRTATAGFEVDDVARASIEAQGLGEFFFHRTGHNIGTEVHGAGANLDNLESHDVRILLPGTLFSVEPGIYLPEFGIRSEVNMLLLDDKAQVTGEEQEQLVRI